MQLQNLLKELVEDSGLDLEFRNSYSGRGMYGRTCVGIVGSERDCMNVIKEAIKEAHELDETFDFDDTVDMLLSFDRDSIAYNVILYWPALESIEDETFQTGEDTYYNDYDN